MHIGGYLPDIQYDTLSQSPSFAANDDKFFI